MKDTSLQSLGARRIRTRTTCPRASAPRPPRAPVVVVEGVLSQLHVGRKEKASRRKDTTTRAPRTPHREKKKSKRARNANTPKSAYNKVKAKSPDLVKALSFTGTFLFAPSLQLIQNQIAS